MEQCVICFLFCECWPSRERVFVGVGVNGQNCLAWRTRDSAIGADLCEELWDHFQSWLVFVLLTI